MNISITTKHPALIIKAKQLAADLNIEFTENPISPYYLVLTPDYLGLQKRESNILPVYVDFQSPELIRRRRNLSIKREALAKAMGLSTKTQPSIVDATAGLGRDSYILACLGFKVTLLERSPIIHALLADGIARAAKDSVIARLQLVATDAIHWLKMHEADLVMLDPMFPDKTKTALSKKNMQFFQSIIGKDDDSEALLRAALACAKIRCVVKRPRLAAPVKGPAPSFCLAGSSSRFDVYLTRGSYGKPSQSA